VRFCTLQRQLWGNKLAGTLPDGITTLTQLTFVPLPP
jgi:hypothetical protein